MQTIVLGAGVIGITTAYYLVRAGHNVIVIDQHDGPGLGTSYANGGQISVSHPEPWAGPEIPWNLLRSLARKDAPFRVRLRWDPAMWSWGLRFLRNCTARRRHAHAALIAELALYGQRSLRELCAETAIEFDHDQRGTLHVFTDPRRFDKATVLATARRAFGIRQQLVDPESCVRIEPALAQRAEKLCGGIYAPDDETGDALLFTQRLAEVCAQRGTKFRYGATITGFELDGHQITSVVTTQGRLTADHYILALGVGSPSAVRALGLRLPVFPVKGYSISLAVSDRNTAPFVNIIHEARRVVVSRLGGRLRIAGGADIVGYDTDLSRQRAQTILAAALDLFPNSGDTSSAVYWAGLRPMTPDGLAMLGPSPYRNLYLNTGHGSLGWTLACGSGRAVADVVSGHNPEIDLQGFSIDRFR